MPKRIADAADALDRAGEAIREHSLGAPALLWYCLVMALVLALREVADAVKALKAKP